MAEKELIKKLIFEDNIESDINGFDYRRHLFDFGIDSDSTLNEKKAIPVLNDKFHESVKWLNIDLSDGMTQALENHRFTSNFDNIWKKRWTYFLQCLQKYNTIAKEEPTFVSLTPIISNFFGVEEYDSEFFAFKFKGVIYLFGKQSLEVKEEVEEGVVSLHNYSMIRFRYLITDRNESNMNNLEECLRVNRIDLKGNKLIVCNTISANDITGSPVYTKCRQIFKIDYKTKELKYRRLIDWSHCVVSGIQTFVLGRRRKSSLEEVKVLPVRTIPYSCREYWSEKKCFSFAVQTLEFIKSCVGSERELYEFTIDSKEKSISSFRHYSDDNSEYFLPKFYTQSNHSLNV